jgi:DNA-binding beta-propeller fold protein YncE
MVARRRFMTIALSLLAGSLVLSTSALAAIRPLVGSFGSFASPTGAAVDQTNGNVYVANGGVNVLDGFDAAGEPTPAGGLPAELTGAETPAGSFNVGEGLPFAVTIDNSCFQQRLNAGECLAADPSDRDMYVADLFDKVVDKFKVNGSKYEYVCQITWAGPGAQACVPSGGVEPEPNAFPLGMTVDSMGNVYVGIFAPGIVYEYNSAGEGLRELRSPRIVKIGGLAVDTAGNLYILGFQAGNVVELKRNGAGEPTGEEVEIVEQGANAIAFDDATDRLLIAYAGGRVAEYDSEGKATGATFGVGSITEPEGIAVNEEHDEVYVSDAGAGKNDADIFGPVVNVPTVATGGISDLTRSGVTLQGTVNPEGSSVASCEFEFGTSLPYARTASCAELPGSGNTPVAVNASVIEELIPNTVYHYRLIAGSAAGTAEGQDATFDTPVAPARVDDVPAFASNLTPFSATLHGTINPENSPTSYHFAYGTSAGYGSIIPIPDLYTPVNFKEDTIVAQRLTGLMPGTTYHFALVALNPGGVETGPDRTFTTPSIPVPSASTGVAEDAAVGAITLTGTIDPYGWDTTYTFQYGTTTAYGSSWPSVPIDMGAVNGAQAVTIRVQDLLPDTTYHYRLTATDGAGTSYGPDLAFTTAGYPASIIQGTPVLPPIGLPAKAPKTKPKPKAVKHKPKKRKRGGGSRKGKKRK